MERFRKLGTQDKAHPDGIWGLAPFIGESRDTVGDFITGGSDGKLKTWRFKSESEVAAETDAQGDEAASAGPCIQLSTYGGHELPVLSVAVSDNGETAVSTSLDGKVKIWNLAVHDSEAKTIQHMAMTEVWDIALSRDGQRAVTGGMNGVVQIIDTSIGQVDETFSIGQNQTDSKESLRREKPMVMSVALNADDTQVAVGAHDGSVAIMDVETGKIIGGKLAKHGGPVRSITFLPNEPRTVLTGSDDQLMNLYDIDAGQVTGTCRGHAGLVLSAKGSDDGKYLVSGGSDRTVQVWDRMMRESVYSYKGHKDAVWGVCYAVNGNRIVSVVDDGCISVLDSSNADKVA